MTFEQVDAALTRYDRLLEARGIAVREHPYGEPRISEDAALENVRWMIPRMREFIETGRLEKLWRWLGWVQGVLWMCGIFTLDEEREHNRTVS